MMTDMITLKQLTDITIQERLEEAEKNRLLNAIATSDKASLEFVVNTVSGWMQRMKPAASANVEQKLATAEIPGV
jgi:hypothetical protein